MVEASNFILRHLESPLPLILFQTPTKCIHKIIDIWTDFKFHVIRDHKAKCKLNFQSQHWKLFSTGKFYRIFSVDEFSTVNSYQFSMIYSAINIFKSDGSFYPVLWKMSSLRNSLQYFCKKLFMPTILCGVTNILTNQFSSFF